MNKASQIEMSSRDYLPLPRLTVRITDATKMLGIGRSKLYELINEGQIETIKLGTSTLIILESIHQLVENRRALRDQG